MTDRELLELAAKAAGITTYWTKDGNKLFRRDGGIQTPWNPLEHDGDALRLAVKLKFNLTYKPIDMDTYPPSPSLVTVWLRHPVTYGLPHTTSLSRFVYEELSDNECAATRRAIVRAAAAIGKESK